MALAHRDLAGVHFTGSTAVFNKMWQTIGTNMSRYASYPRIVGETGGKDFIVAHPSADPQALAVAIARGGFEYQGQKCSAASRVYVPRSLWKEVKERTVAIIEELKVGDVTDFQVVRQVVDPVADQGAARGVRAALEHPQGRVDVLVHPAADQEGRRRSAAVVGASEPCRQYGPSCCWRSHSKSQIGVRSSRSRHSAAHPAPRYVGSRRHRVHPDHAHRVLRELRDRRAAAEVVDVVGVAVVGRHHRHDRREMRRPEHARPGSR